MSEPTTAERQASIPAKRVANRDLLNRPGGVGGDLPSLIECEQTIMACEAESAELVADYAELSTLAATAQADWENHRDRVYLALRNSGEWKSEALGQAEAKGLTSIEGPAGEDLYRAYLIMKGALDSCGKHMSSVQSRQSVQQSLLKHLRQITGLE